MPWQTMPTFVSNFYLPINSRNYQVNTLSINPDNGGICEYKEHREWTNTDLGHTG
jgi:hypothetical protein